MLPALKLLSVIDIKSIFVVGLTVVGLFMIFIQGGLLFEIAAEVLESMAEAINPL